jgi:hypothetical protein
MNLTGRPVMQKGVKARRVPAMRNAAREQPCTLRLDCCNRDWKTVSLNHLRFFNVAGIGQKPHDFLGVFGCSNCHAALDRVGDGTWGFEDILRALGETLIAQYNAGNLKMRGE